MGGFQFQFQPKSLAAVVIVAFLIASDNPPAASALHPYGFQKNCAIAVDSKVVGSRKMVGAWWKRKLLWGRE
ncbi:hypothetical protein L6164_014760 [Bauhinia variegata]|uniref:Uncharacterized protein n=1 Tax=Bauhinia variegata TaxID=167791 RepID=A0ACB9NK28_BAUVA|nr:hypothetical protein L6164_014760 [Bauhinia variegata]